MTSREKVLNVEAQVREIAAGKSTEFDCPFCGIGSTPEMGALCCSEAAEVVNAVLDHIEHLDRCAVIERAMDRLESMQAKQSPLVMN